MEDFPIMAQNPAYEGSFTVGDLFKYLATPENGCTLSENPIILQ
jgi:hypothetical protein